MGKHRRYDDEEYIDRKIRKLEKRKSKICRRRRRSYKSSDSLSSYETVQFVENSRRRSEDSGEETDLYMQEDLQYEESPTNINMDIEPPLAIPPASDEPDPLVSHPLPTSVVIPATVPSTSAQASSAIDGDGAQAPSTSVATTDLDPDILCILGEEPVKEDKFGPCIHKDIANRWSDLLINGLKNDTKKEIVQRYEIPENFKLAMPPTLNPEIKAACNENVIKRDNILFEKQDILATVISSLSSTITTLLNEDHRKNEIIKSLSDAGRLLCHLHFSETQTRRNFLLTSLDKDIRSNIKDLKRDDLLFGKELQDNLKSIKAITKTGAELRQVGAKPKPQPRSKQMDASSSRALNWRGAPAPAPPPAPPRRAQARPISSSGGRRQPPPPPPPRRTSDRRAPPRYRGQTSRR